MANTTGLKFGGRQKGTPNKTTAELRQILQDTLQSEVANIPEYLNQLPMKERVDMIVKLLPYILPRMATQIHLDSANSEPINKLIFKMPDYE
jgi:hypothetical protein